MKTAVIECVYNGICAVKPHMISQSEEDRHIKGMFIDIHTLRDLIRRVFNPEYSLLHFPELLDLYYKIKKDDENDLPRT